MKVSLNWLKELVDLPADVSALCDLLTKAGVEVEGIETRGVSTDKVVVAQILESAQHPNADRLSVCQVDDGSRQPRQIVCGAKNFKVGDKVPLALPGAVLPGDFKIKVGKLRGVQSEGMMCSAKELSLAEDAEGLLILDAALVVGTPLNQIYPAETVLDLEVTPNRPDLLSHLGMAREIATLVKNPLRVPVEVLTAEQSVVASSSGITLEAHAECPFYTARRIRGVKVGPSPEWLKTKLESVGLRSINNVVDITNFVMLELGQPLHAFDAAKIAGGLRIRLAKEGEKLKALDDKEYTLAATHLVIADAERLLAIAGVMGGLESGVTGATTDIVLESAFFAPTGIRRTSRELGLSSDSSYRFERGVDPQGVVRVSERAAQLIVALAGGVAEPTIEAAGEVPAAGASVPFRLERCRAVLGAQVSEADVDQILSGFGLERLADGWRAPSFRRDLVREIDLIEEIARVIGIEAVPPRGLTGFFQSSEADQRHDEAMRLRNRLAALGFYEARSLTLISDAGLALFPVEGALRVRNPLNEEQVILRPSLLPGLLEAVARNVRAGTRDLRLFEVGRVFRGEGGEGNGGREERNSLAFVYTGAVDRASWRDSKPRVADFFDAKGVLESIGFGGGVGAAARGSLTFEAVSHPVLPLATAIRWNGEIVGVAGQLPPAAGRELDVTTPVLVAEIDLDLVKSASGPRRFTELPKFPAVTRDIALVLSLAVSHQQVEEQLKAANEPLLVKTELFDVFTDATGERIPVDKKSVAYALTYRSSERTLTADEVATAHSKLKERLKTELGASFRE